MNRPNRPLRMAIVMVAVGLIMGSCAGTELVNETPVVRIAFLQDVTVPAHVDLVSPSFLAFEQSVHEGTAGLDVQVEVVQSDTENDPARARELAEEVAGDPSYILAVVAPFWRAPPDVTTTLAEAGVPIVSLSPLSPSPGGSSRRFVPDQVAQGAAIAALVERAMGGEEEPACMLGEETDASFELTGIVDAELPRIVPRRVVVAGDPAAGVAQVREGCALTVWTGSTEGADGLAEAFRNAGITRDPPIDIASDALKTVIPGAAVDPGRAAVGSLTCPCVDLSLDTSESARTFLNAYQAANGLAPGVYAAEAWDAGSAVASALKEGVRAREQMGEFVAGLEGWSGVAGTIRFDQMGEPIEPRVGTFGPSGTRWLPLGD